MSPEPANSSPPSSSPRNWVTTLIFGSTFAAAILLVPIYGFLEGYDAVEWVAFGVMLCLCGFSITAGYHRLWSHRSYEARLPLRIFWAVWGACALQNSILVWASGHRRHHRHVDDTEKDPYSIKRGFWFAHIGWMLREYPSGRVDLGNAADLLRDPVVRLQHQYYALLVLATNVGLPLLLGVLNGDIIGMFLLAGVLRLVISHHVTFFINSLAHIWGRQPYTDSNTARDNDLLALVTYGEGYHNFHHFFQSDYRNGVRWWQFDPTKWLIRALSWLGLAHNLKRTPRFKIQEALVGMELKRAQEQLRRKEATLKLSDPVIPDYFDALRQALETEAQQFKATLAEWKELRMAWYQRQKQAIADRREALQSTFTDMASGHRIRELEYVLKMQRKRLSIMVGNMMPPQLA